MTRIALAAVAAALMLPSAAHAARPTLTQERADQAAQEEAASFAEELQTGQWEIDPCEVEKRRAYCDFTFTSADEDWGTCDGEFVIQYTRRGRLAISTEILLCE